MKRASIRLTINLLGGESLMTKKLSGDMVRHDLELELWLPAEVSKEDLVLFIEGVLGVNTELPKDKNFIDQYWSEDGPELEVTHARSCLYIKEEYDD